MSFLNFQSSQTPTQSWVNASRIVAMATIQRVFAATLQTYNGMWDQKDTDPQGPLDRIAALGTGAAAAFQAHAASVQYLLSVLPLFDGTADMIAQAQTWTLPAGWTITFNPDGSANVTPPTQSSTGA